MASIDFDALGDYHKKLEGLSETRLIPGVPVIARLDGRAFHTLTRNAVKPYDENFITCMETTCIALVKEFNASIGYVQSDEISLVWSSLDTFDGRIQKLCSVMSGIASVVFNEALNQTYFKHSVSIPVFDCRIWQVPSLSVAAENLMWREMDASKNSISMAAHALFGSKRLENVPTKQRLALLEQHGYFWNELDARLKRGSFFKKVIEWRELTEEELEKIPAQHRPNHPVERSAIKRMEWERLTTMTNAMQVLFLDSEPNYYEK